MGQEFITSTEIIAAARKNLKHEAWGRLDGGAETETTVARNRLGFDTLAFQPRVLMGVTEIDTSTTFLGERLRIPVMTAPIGSSHSFTKDGINDIARAAEAFGIVPILASMTKGTTWEAVARVTGGPKILQLAFSGDFDWAREAIGRVRTVGYKALCFAFDTPRFGRLEREMMATREGPRTTSPLRTGMSWEILGKLVQGAGIPLIAKGITHPDDARRLTDYGFEVIYVSNHGGESLDHARGAIESLPDVVSAVAGRAQVILDGGVMRGTDVIKALALGASAVAIGRLQCFGLGAGGEAGLVRLLEILEEEIFYAMTFLGTPTIADISRDHIFFGAPPVIAPSLFSAFPLLGE